MTNTTNTNASAAYLAYATTVNAAMTDRDRDLTETAQARRRAEAIQAARETLRASIPAAPAASGTREAVLTARAPRTADEVALHAREREKVAALVAAGRPLADVIAEASELRVAALADDIEVARARDPYEAEDAEDALFGRLIDLGAADAVAAEAQHQEVVTARAWANILAAAADGQDSDGADWTAVFHGDAEGYAATHGAGFVLDNKVLNRAATPPQL